MPYVEKEITKRYFSISEVSKSLGVNASLIRFWESEFEIISPKKDKKGNRLFTEKDIKDLRLVHSLLKEKGYTIEGAKQKLKNHQKEFNKMELRTRLEKVRNFLVQLKEEID